MKMEMKTINYWTALRVDINGDGQVVVSLQTNTIFYLTGIKVNILLVADKFEDIKISGYSYHLYVGEDVPKSIFTSDFGVNPSQFGTPLDGERCLMGILELNLKKNQNKETSFFFQLSGSKIL